MQLVLLSGGSGKRLWPLSNNARSKQFLPLLLSPTGSRESMIQRVVRQVKESNFICDITFATNSQQRDIIINQIGEEVSIVSEPERRDTFPAIALATSYLAFEKQCDRDEVVVVMPCDVYTESSYFQVIAEMAGAIQSNVSQLLLMGIRPNYPSEKFGYIIPEDNNLEQISRVKAFTEKPSTEQAQKLIQLGAMWNGGVFAFRLGYMIDILKQYLPVSTFNEVRAQYSSLPKISFDYEVVEKATSVSVIPFSGLWRDLGTWNALCEQLPNETIGNVYIGDNRNSHIINELGIPLFCNGLDNVVVAASSDGIMVCNKDKSEQIKEYVDDFITRPMFEERRWGSYRVLDNQEHSNGIQSLTKSITIQPGKCISYQIHHHRSEVWTIVEGTGIFVLNGQKRDINVGDVLVIPRENYHAIKAITKLTFIEVQLGSPLIEEDIERFDYIW